jgi:hypothetical protein
LKEERKIANVVKIDEKLLQKVKKIVSSDANRIRYSNVKQFISVAVLEKLEKEMEVTKRC